MSLVETSIASRDVAREYEFIGDPVLDSQIPATIQEYYDCLQNGDREMFKKLSISQKINSICWNWGTHPDAEIQAKSQDFKAKLYARSLGQLMLSNGAKWEQHSLSKTKHCPTLDPYWAKVDAKLRVELFSFLNRNNGDPSTNIFSLI